MLKYGNMLGTTRMDSSPPPSSRRNVFLVGVAIFFYWAAMYLYVPILPVYARSLGASLSMVGVIVAAYALPQLLLRIPLGVWSDRLGRRKPIALAGVVMVLLGASGLAFAPSPWFIVLARTAVGVGAAIWVVIAIYFVSLFPGTDASRPIGFMYFINNGALVVATLSGGIIADAWGAAFTFYGAVLLGMIGVAALALSTERETPQPEAISWKGFVHIARRPLLLLVSVMGTIHIFAQFTGVLGFIPVYAREIGASDTEIGLVTMFHMGAAMIGSLAHGSLTGRRGYPFTIVMSSLVVALATLAVPLVHTVPVLHAVQSVNGLGRGVLAATLMSLSIHGVVPQQRATAMGFFQATYCVGMLVGPLISGFLADSHGLASIFYLSGSLTLVIAVLAFLPVFPRKGG